MQYVVCILYLPFKKQESAKKTAKKRTKKNPTEQTDEGNYENEPMDYDPGDQEGVISNGDDDVDEDGESNDEIFVSLKSLKCDKTRKTYLKTVWNSLNPPIIIS